MADLALLESQLKGVLQQLEASKAQYAEAQKAGDATRMAEISNYRAELASTATDIRAQIDTAKKEAALAAPPDPATAEYVGQTPNGTYRYYNPITQKYFLSFTSPTSSQQAAYDKVNPAPASSAAADVLTSDTGATQNPPTPAAVLVVPESQINIARDIGPAEQSDKVTRDGGQAVPDDSGATKTTTQTQSVSSTEGRDTPQAGGTAGVAASGDDSGTKQVTAQVVKAALASKITPRGNLLDQYPSYSYNFTWYIMQPGTLETFLKSTKKSINGMQILMRSGGAPMTSAGTTSTSTGPNSPTNITGTQSGIGARNSFFDNDYYMDDFELESIVMGPYNRSPHNVTRLKFSVAEPNGITLINNLWQAVNQLYKTNKLPYSRAQYCLALRFYGYDNNGNLISSRDNTGTDPNAIVERFYPFSITNIAFRVANKQVVYQVEGIGLGQGEAFGQNLGVIKKQVELSGTTVGQVLGGISQGSNPAPGADGRQSTSVAPQSVSPIPYTGSYLSAAEMQANQDWYNKYGAQYNADGTLKG